MLTGVDQPEYELAWNTGRTTPCLTENLYFNEQEYSLFKEKALNVALLNKIGIQRQTRIPALARKNRILCYTMMGMPITSTDRASAFTFVTEGSGAVWTPEPLTYRP
jgi:hypothetical protein